jgi:hypothetical protein
LGRGGRCTITTADYRPKALIQLVYASVASRLLGQAELEAIAARSAARNAESDITGLLLHQDGHFYGVMEGPQSRVFRRMEAIITDRRHSGVRILREVPITERRFESWSFGVLPLMSGHGAESPESFVLNLSRHP